MTQEERQKQKELLLNVLKDGLPHGIQLQITDINEFTFNGELCVLSKNWCRLNITDSVKKARVKNQTIPLNYIYIKPYLRPMSSMTEEEILNLQKINPQFNFDKFDNFAYVGAADDGFCFVEEMDNILNYLNSKHLDYRGLIPKGLAIEVTKENNPYEDINL